MITAEKIMMFSNRLAKVFRHTGKIAKKTGVTCYRIYDHDLPEFPFCIEFYEDNLYVAEYRRRHGMTEDEHDQWLEESLKVISEVLKVTGHKIFLKLRQRKPGRLGQYSKLDGIKQEFVVNENGLKFIVNLSDYLDTGLFLDHRITREYVRKEAHNKKALNLFAYTGSFSVYAAAGGAAEVVTVDLSKTYLDWAKRNMQLNHFSDDLKYTYIHTDVVRYLQTLQEEYFDIIILDPPTFSNSKRMNDFLDIQRDHAVLINACLKGLKQGGILYFSTNYRKFMLEKAKLHASLVQEITKATTPFDFEGKLARYCFKITK
ncbi:MAG: class I SAM-dependent methyltransferase [Bacteroidota bacterium]|nr:class I SAM-dependent methyltransferase [Bacteroidota bacterium]